MIKNLANKVLNLKLNSSASKNDLTIRTNNHQLFALKPDFPQSYDLMNPIPRYKNKRITTYDSYDDYDHTYIIK